MFSILIVLLNIFFSSGLKDGVCGPNSKHVSNQSICYQTCGKKNTVLTTCQNSFSGCLCLEGYVKHEDKCALPSNCPESCDPNEEWTTSGSTCPKTCTNYHISSEECSIVHSEGCRCKNGFLYHNGGCIKKSLCPDKTKCGPNSKFTSKASLCPKTCDNYLNHVQKRCSFTSACDCLEGFVLHRGMCINPKFCPKIACGPNEEFSECKNHCPKTCDNFHLPPEDCPAGPCQKGCQCSGIYVLYDYRCVHPKNCPLKKKICKKNAEWKLSTSPCRLTCSNPIRDLYHPCPIPNISECVCKDGYLLHEDKCIHPTFCPKKPPNCPFNEIWNKCKPTCEMSCENRSFWETMPCSKICTEGCACKKGFLRDHHQKCVNICSEIHLPVFNDK